MKDSDRDEGNALRWRSTGNDKSELVINEYMDRQLDAGKRRRRILRLICLIVGGVIASPIAAWLCKKIPLRPLIAIVGLLIIGVNTWKLITSLGL